LPSSAEGARECKESATSMYTILCRDSGSPWGVSVLRNNTGDGSYDEVVQHCEGATTQVLMQCCSGRHHWANALQQQQRLCAACAGHSKWGWVPQEGSQSLSPASGSLTAAADTEVTLESHASLLLARRV